MGSAKCGSDGTFDFVVNQSNSDSQSWSPVFLTRSAGATGLFIPSSVDLIFFTPEGNADAVARHVAANDPARRRPPLTARRRQLPISRRLGE